MVVINASLGDVAVLLPAVVRRIRKRRGKVRHRSVVSVRCEFGEGWKEDHGESHCGMPNVTVNITPHM